MSKRADNEIKAKTELKALEDDVARLKIKINAAEAQYSPEHKHRFERIEHLCNEANAKINELLQASDAAFDEVEGGLQHYYTALGNELKAYDRL